MSEIEKLYELAEIKCEYDCTYASCCVCKNPHPDWCKECKYLSVVYPPFTAEKQLELIKWLSKKQYVYIIMSADKEYYLCTDNSFISGYNKQFDKALAMFINAYWQDLSENEQEEIRKILKG